MKTNFGSACHQSDGVAANRAKIISRAAGHSVDPRVDRRGRNPIANRRHWSCLTEGARRPPFKPNRRGSPVGINRPVQRCDGVAHAAGRQGGDNWKHCNDHRSRG